MKNTTPKVIGITGTIGAGKSLVGKLLEDLKVPVIDTDKVVHHLLEDDTPTRAAVIERFGKTIQTPDGTINRRALGAIVFADSKARKDLEAIVHPAVRSDCRCRIEEFSKEPLVAVLVPLLFEAGMKEEYDQIWTVVTNEPILRERLKDRDKMTDEDIDRRLRAQWPQSKKAEQAHIVIDNSGSREETSQQLTVLIQKQRSALRESPL